MVSSCFSLAIVVALAGAADPKNDKLAAVNKVTDLLVDLQKSVNEEGVKEAETYNKFACFCKDNIKGKQSAITAGKDGKKTLAAEITKKSDDRDTLDADIKKLVEEIDAKEKAIKKLNKDNKAAVEKYEINAADLNGAIKGIDGAMKVLKANKGKKNTVFLQMPDDMKKTIERAALMADALGLSSGSAVSAFLQHAPVSAMAETSTVAKIEPYAFQGDDIIGLLTKLQTDFKAEKTTLDADEKTRKDKYDKDLANAEKYVKDKNTALDGKRTKRGKTIKNIAVANTDYAGVSAQLLDDLQYLKELSQICSDKAQTWDQRNKVRADELSAITAAIVIVKGTVSDKTSKATTRLIENKFTAQRAAFMIHNEEAMEAVEEDAEKQEAAPLGFLQKRSSPFDGVHLATRALDKMLSHPETMTEVSKHGAGSDDSHPADGRQAVMMLLRKRGIALHSSMLTSLATQIGGDPFVKIKKLIQELIERMLTEAANESSQKGWCDKALGDARQKRDYTAEKLKDLNGESAELEARRDALVEELATLKTEIADLTKAQKDADAERKTEKAENKDTVDTANAGLDAVKQAIQILDRFYKTAAKSKVEISLAQGPADDMPDSGFDSGEAYTGAQGKAGGVIGMLEVIESDFVRTVKETEKAEQQAEDDHLKFTTETQSSLAAKNMANDEKTKAKDETVQSLSDASDGMKEKTTLLRNTIKELLELQPTCIDTGMSYKERVAAREQEIDSLQKALCIFEAYQKYGADGAGAKC